MILSHLKHLETFLTKGRIGRAGYMDSITSSINKIRKLEAKYNRPGKSVFLLAVSKRKSVERIQEAVNRGINHFGENYLQEALEKISALSALNLKWHYIGPMQSNKTQKIAQAFDWVQSVDRKKIAVRLNDHRGQKLGALNVCVQVNLSNEESKSGVCLNEVEALCEIIGELPNLKLRGLMTIPAPQSDFDLQRKQFGKLARKFNCLKQSHPHLDTLSMGMSDDFEAAIAEGSTMVRLGTALFGTRE
jgi:pyridoxal phosphate enzyme (YggS family)